MTDGLRELYPGRSGACLMVFQSLLFWTVGASVVHTHWFSVPLTTEGLRVVLGDPVRKEIDPKNI